MYEFILIQYFYLNKIDADQVRSYAPRWITKEQAEEIIARKEE